jgi:hypothetical protein
LFNGSNQYLTIPSNAAFALSTGDFTVETWAYFTSIGASKQAFMDCDTAGQFGFNINNNVLTAFASSGASWTFSYTFTASTWYHIALVRQSSTLSCYINGVSIGTPQSVTTNFTSPGTFIISKNATISSEYISGYVTNFRIVKGTAVYTANFTPAPVLQAITNTSFLLQVASSAAIITDSSTNAFTVTNNNTATYSSLIPFNEGETNGSLLFNTTSQYLSVPSNAAYDFGTGDFTIECWLYGVTNPGASSGYNLIFCSPQTNSYTLLTYNSAIYLNFNGANFLQTATGLITQNVWYHIAVVRQSGVTKIYLNGVSRASIADTNNYSGSPSRSIGPSAGGTAGFYMTNTRIVKGTALYTATFTPSTTPLTAVSGTSLLIQQNDNSAGTLTSTGTGKISMTSASAKKFLGNKNSYATINQGGAGDLTIVGSNSFQNITNSVQPATIKFTAATTSTFTNGFSLAGTAGNLITLGSNILAPSTLSKASGTVSVSYCTISYSAATGGASWLAPTSSGNVDGGNNTGWSFTAVLTATAYLGMMAFF